MENMTQVMILTPAIIKAWEAPTCQRPLSINKNVKALTSIMLNPYVNMPGTILLGIWNGKTYLIDGQHRGYAFLQTNRPTIDALVEIHHYVDGPAGEVAMSLEYIERNKQLVVRKADDTLRAMEAFTPMLRTLRDNCPFVAYSRIHSSGSTVRRMISMSNLLRYWTCAGNEAPATFATAEQIAKTLTQEQVDTITPFLNMCLAAWGYDKENDDMWCQLNMTVTMWLYRHTVLDTGSALARITKISPETFQRCLVATSVDTDYCLWLNAIKKKAFTDSRSACLRRLREIFAKVLCSVTGMKRSNLRMPQPDWMLS